MMVFTCNIASAIVEDGSLAYEVLRNLLHLPRETLFL